MILPSSCKQRVISASLTNNISDPLVPAGRVVDLIHGVCDHLSLGRYLYNCLTFPSPNLSHFTSRQL